MTSTSRDPTQPETAAAAQVLESGQRSSVLFWTPAEDHLLAEAVKGVPSKDWSLITSKVPGRTSKQCWQRYNYHLKREFRTGEWTAEEDALIIQHRAAYGNHWSLIARAIPGRSDNTVKNRHSPSPVQRRVGAADWPKKRQAPAALACGAEGDAMNTDSAASSDGLWGGPHGTTEGSKERDLADAIQAM